MRKEMAKCSKEPRPKETTIPHEAGSSCNACKIGYHSCLNEPENVYAKHLLVLTSFYVDSRVRN